MSEATAKMVVRLDTWSPEGLVSLGRHIQKYELDVEVWVNPRGMIRTPEPYFVAQWNSSTGAWIGWSADSENARQGGSM